MHLKFWNLLFSLYFKIWFPNLDCTSWNHRYLIRFFSEIFFNHRWHVLSHHCLQDWKPILCLFDERQFRFDSKAQDCKKKWNWNWNRSNEAKGWSEVYENRMIKGIQKKEMKQSNKIVNFYSTLKKVFPRWT